MNADGSVTINGPMMARADRLAVNVKTATGSMKFLMVNGNAEAVPTEAFRTAAALGLGHFAVQNNTSNNAKSNYSTAAGVASKPPTVLTNTAADGTVTQTAIPFVPPPQP